MTSEPDVPWEDDAATCTCGHSPNAHKTPDGSCFFSYNCDCEAYEQASHDQGVWKMTDVEFKAELHKEFMRGFRAGRATNQAGIDLSLQALDTLIAEGIEYKEARALLDEFRNRAVAKA